MFTWHCKYREIVIIGTLKVDNSNGIINTLTVMAYTKSTTHDDDYGDYDDDGDGSGGAVGDDHCFVDVAVIADDYSGCFAVDADAADYIL